MNVIQAKYFYAPKTHEINWEKAEPWRTFFKKNNTLLRYVVQSRTHFDSLRPHGLQHARLPCPSLSPQVCSNSCPLSQWFYLTISCSTASSHIIYPFKIYNLIFFLFFKCIHWVGQPIPQSNLNIFVTSKGNSVPSSSQFSFSWIPSAVSLSKHWSIICLYMFACPVHVI